MYIALKWLVVLAIAMWLGMCSLDSYIKQVKDTNNKGVYNRPFNIFKNETARAALTPVANKPRTKKDKLHLYYNDKREDGHSTAGLHCLMFIAGALAVTAFQKKKNIIIFAHRKIPTINMVISQWVRCLKIAALKSRVAIVKYSLYMWDKYIKIVTSKIRNKINSLKLTPAVKQNKIHVILLKKLKEMADERKNLGQLLITALSENKNIRMRYELETMTKNRLMQHIEDTQKQIKENRSKYVSFQQLYLVTHQENTYLKARILKLKREKDETSKNLMGLINEVYKSKNQDLKTYCTRFLVKTKDKILNSDVGAEIKEFLENNRKPSENFAPMASSSSLRITEIDDEENCLVPLASDAPKLRGLPGEYVWTVKDKNGLIEKLYEYDFESDFDSGDTIRRIRQYSVYYDKDCLVDYPKVVHEANASGCPSRLTKRNLMDHCLDSKKIVTGSEAFQNFLKCSIVQSKPSSAPLLYD